jgi:ubiquinone/menaquinone biosynthesis C-methylase UbiE
VIPAAPPAQPDQASIGIANVSDYWNRRPCNIRHSPSEVGTRAYFDEVEARKYLVEPHIPAFADFPRWKGKKVLEIGCGIGTDSINFARAGADVTVVDVSEASLELCRKRFDLFGLKARFFSGNAEDLGSFIPEEKYDLIYSFGVIHHTPRPERVIEQLHRFCGPATEVRIMVYSRWSWKTLAIVARYGKGAFWRARDLVRTYSEAQTGCPVTYTYSTEGARKLLDGFEVERVWKDHIFPYRIGPYVNYEYRRVWYFAWMPKPLFAWLERRLGWHTMLIAREPAPA